ncbi:DUF6188 family protein [Tunturiibacter empetritectus]|uniref:Uncharacterized protein n=1 Tax=Tunturiibacter lichenicola TaxID=2051959 RepID=A0A852VBI7_9BACT|nr:DUF6188 family protein [Edaphobacter lichenicola]NYF88189.1 hypothetical protein [Edaphobacter lichenicola]
MHGLAADADLSFLKGKLLTQICFGEFQVQLHFHEESTYISVESSFEFEQADGVFEKYVVGPESGERNIHQFANQLTKFIGGTVEHVEWVVDGTLTLTFPTHGKLRVLDDNPRFEAYQIGHGKDFFVI